MPEKKNGGLKNAIGAYINEYAKEAAHFFFSMLERHVRRYAIALALLIASLAAIIYGIGSLLGYFFPAWPAGISHIIVGVLFLLAVLRYSKR